MHSSHARRGDVTNGLIFPSNGNDKHMRTVRADKRMAWRVVGSLSGLAAGAATRAALRSAWRKTHGGEPPTNPAARGVAWTDALVWAIASGVALAVARLLAQRGAAEVWRAAAGAYPPDMENVA